MSPSLCVCGGRGEGGGGKGGRMEPWCPSQESLNLLTILYLETKKLDRTQIPNLINALNIYIWRHTHSDFQIMSYAKLCFSTFLDIFLACSGQNAIRNLSRTVRRPNVKQDLTFWLTSKEAAYSELGIPFLRESLHDTPLDFLH